MAKLVNTANFLRNLYGKCGKINKDKLNRSFNTVVQEKKKGFGLLKTSVISITVGAAIGVGYAFQKISRDRKNFTLEGTEIKIDDMKHKPHVQPSRRVISPVDPTNLKLTLFQYQTCPFCCKVRSLLDYYGISYDIVEVNPVFKTELKWSSYKKVPIVLVKTDEGYKSLVDSSMIVSILGSYIHDQSYKINELIKYYPTIGIRDDDGKFKHEILNKYFLMHQASIPKNRSLDDIVEERKWRKWVDDVFVHTLSPNVYRTLDEAYQSFQYFADVGKWNEYFPYWERLLMVNVGAVTMWIIGKQLKKKYNLKDDVRQSFYDEVNRWLKAINARGGQFMGGNNPDLSDLAVYGALKGIEGCDAFKDVLKHTKIKIWYDAVNERVNNHSGATLLNS